MMNIFRKKDAKEEEPSTEEVPNEIHTESRIKLSKKVFVHVYRDEENVKPKEASKGENQSAEDGPDADAATAPPTPPHDRASATTENEEKGSAFLFRTPQFGKSSEDPATGSYVFEEDNESIEMEMQHMSLWPEKSNKGRGQLLMAAMICLAVLALILGLALGLKDNSSNEAQTSGDQTTTNTGAQNGGNSRPSSSNSKDDIPGPTITVPAPTNAPITVSTNPPSETPCVDSIDSSKDCYSDDAGDVIWVAFDSCQSIHDDVWIGIYNVDEVVFPVSNLGESYSMWLWACGTQNIDDCANGNLGIEADTLPFANSNLPHGMYRAFLVRTNENDENVPYAVSQEFERVAVCS